MKIVKGSYSDDEICLLVDKTYEKSNTLSEITGLTEQKAKTLATSQRLNIFIIC